MKNYKLIEKTILFAICIYFGKNAEIDPLSSE
jgi:hypothetical protein